MKRAWISRVVMLKEISPKVIFDKRYSYLTVFASVLLKYLHLPFQRAFQTGIGFEA